MSGEVYYFKSNTPKTIFAPSWNFSIYENIVDFDFDKLFKIILKKEKEIIKKYPAIDDGNTGLGDKSLTSRFPYFNLLQWKEFSFLKKIIKENYISYLKKIKLKPKKNIYVQCWANVLRKEEQIKLHKHDTTHFSYLGGHIVIKANNTNTDYQNPINDFIWKSENKIGKVTLFPNYIGHYTDKVETNDERVTIAFDIRDKVGFELDIYSEMKHHWVKI